MKPWAPYTIEIRICDIAQVKNVGVIRWMANDWMGLAFNLWWHLVENHYLPIKKRENVRVNLGGSLHNWNIKLCFVYHHLPDLMFGPQFFGERAKYDFVNRYWAPYVISQACYPNHKGEAYSAVIPNNKVHGANMGPTWVPSAPDGPILIDED